MKGIDSVKEEYPVWDSQSITTKWVVENNQADDSLTELLEIEYREIEDPEVLLTDLLMKIFD